MKKLLMIAFYMLLLAFTVLPGYAQRISRDLNVDLLVNQAGYVPDAGKMVVTKGLRDAGFEVISLETRKVAFTGKFRPEEGDFGEYSVGDFSQVRGAGHYYIKCDTLRSTLFEISSSAYRKPVEKIVRYFSLQRWFKRQDTFHPVISLTVSGWTTVSTRMFPEDNDAVISENG
jgi:hypothetical protein